MGRMPDHDEQGRGHRVRPRWVWGALLVLLLGTGVAGWGAVVMSWVWVLAGAGVFLVGVVLALAGNLFYDIHSSAGVRPELHDLVHGESHLGPDPTARVDDTAARETARREAAALRERQAATAAVKPRLFGRSRGQAR